MWRENCGDASHSPPVHLARLSILKSKLNGIGPKPPPFLSSEKAVLILISSGFIRVFRGAADGTGGCPIPFLEET